MQEIQLSSAPQIKVVFDGQEYLMRKPKILEVRQLESELTSDDPAIKADATLNFIAGCGIPKAVLEQLDIDGLNALTDALMPKKKV